MPKTLRPTRARKTHRTTGRGLVGAGGGHVSWVPVPLRWRGTTRQICGLYPWSSPGALPIIGAPLGRHQKSGETVCFDHISWFEAKLIPNPSATIIGKPGMGKSTIASKMALSLVASGYTLLIPGDTKPDYAELTKKIGGQLRQVRRTSGAAFNPCDPGGMVAAGRRIGGITGQAVIGEAYARAVTLIGGLVELSRKERIHDYEESALGAALENLYQLNPTPPLIDDVINYIAHREPGMFDAITASTDDEYDALMKPLLRSLRALISGKFGDVFSRQSERIENAVAVNIDTSAIKAGDPAFLGAVMMAAWADVYGQVEADQALADADLQPRRRYCLILDELWRVLNLGGTLPDRVNELTRLNRTQGVGQLMISHSVKDDPTGGLFERAGAVIIGGVPEAEIKALENLVTLTGEEKTALKSWWASGQGSLEPNVIAPGAGKFLIKPSADDPGIPVDVILSSVEVEWGGQNTNSAWEMVRA